MGIRDDLVRRLLEGGGKLPTSSIARYGRLAVAGLRGRKAVKDPDVETVARIISSIGELKGVSMKIGQIMSYIDVELPEELREALSVLQTHAQPMPVDEVREIVASELGARGRALADGLEETPLAAASIGQVHSGTLPDGTEVAVKVQYPGIEDAIRSDFKPAGFGSMMSSMVYRGARIDSFIAEARARFLEECDYEHEARVQDRFAGLYAGHEVLEVPAVHLDHCSRRVLTTTLVHGSRFDEFLASDPPKELRDLFGRSLFAFYIGTLFQHGLYNCDPHPGNYLFLPGDRIAMLDHGCVREFTPPFVEKLANLTRAVHADEHDGLHAAFLELGMVREGKRYDYETARGLVRSFYGPMLRDEEAAIDLGGGMGMGEIYRSKRELMKLTLPGEFLFLFRIRFGLMSVLSRLGARANWYRLEREMVAQSE